MGGNPTFAQSGAVGGQGECHKGVFVGVDADDDVGVSADRRLCKR